MSAVKTIAIMQPTYLPWVGYFDLMDQVDEFVLLDDTQFAKRSWQQRNRIKTSKGLEWLTVPVTSKGLYSQKILDVAIADPGFAEVHLKTLRWNYQKARYEQECIEPLRECYGVVAVSAQLVDLNLRLIRWFAGRLGVNTPLVRSSALDIPGVRSERLVALCQARGATRYLSPVGSAVYLLQDLDLFRRTGIEVVFHHYEHPAYDQLHPPFLPYASAIDLLFNLGPDAPEMMRSGRRPRWTADEVAGMQMVAEEPDVD
jgi:hypothetical protein